MSVLHSIVPYEQVFVTDNEVQYINDEMMYDGMLVEVKYDADNIVLTRIIDGPLHNYLETKYTPGTIIGKRHSYIK